MTNAHKFWLEWCMSSYRPGQEYTTHAVPDEGPTHALCGAKTDEGHGGVVGEDGEPGCKKCRKALRKLGMIE